MAKRILYIDSTDQGHFFLSVEGRTLTLGDRPGHAEAVLPDLRISRIHCEIEVDEDILVVNNLARATATPGGQAVEQELNPGEAFYIGHAQVRLEPDAAVPDIEAPPPVLGDDMPRFADESPPAAPPAQTTSPAPAPTTRFTKQLVVIDGADKGRFFSLPHAGSTTIGKSTKNADIVLHDLFVARVHCEVQVDEDKVMVSHIEGDNGTLINGQRITGPQELQQGGVLRIGNSHLRLDSVLLDDRPDDSGANDSGADESVPEVESIEVIEEAAAKTEDQHAAPEPAQQPAQPAADAQEPADQLMRLEGQVLGHYQIASLLGRGQSGVVFCAQDQRNKHVVALKVLVPVFPATAAELQQFARVLKVAPHLHHVNLVQFHGAGKTGAYCWIAREYVEGESVARIIQRMKDEGKLTWKRAVRVAVHLGRALALLHEHKLVHGNITPRNILVSSSYKLTKLADLMLVQALAGSRLHEAIAGKKLLAELPYLAPEQTEAGAFVDHLADLYAVGSVAYTLLTGQPPFAGASADEITAQVRTAKVVKPTKFQRGIPAPVEAAVLKLLAKHQEDRYQTPALLLADLEPIVQEHEIKV